jgi:hypothetical protein
VLKLLKFVITATYTFDRTGAHAVKVKAVSPVTLLMFSYDDSTRPAVNVLIRGNVAPARCANSVTWSVCPVLGSPGDPPTNFTTASTMIHETSPL